MSHLLLNFAAVRNRSQVNGPGIRSVIWVQGCTLNCPGCFNPHTHWHEARNLVDPDELAGLLLAVRGTEGLTISGGEPFQQAEACAVLARTVQQAGRSVMVFSGYPYPDLLAAANPAIAAFLRCIDILVAGPYIERLKTDGRGWRASANQEVLFLSDRYMAASPNQSPDETIVEVKVDGHAMRMTGFPDSVDLRWLRNLRTGGRRI